MVFPFKKDRVTRVKLSRMVVCALLVFCASVTLQALSMRPMKTDELIDTSEHIFTAVCESRTAEFRNGNIFTKYELRPTDVWKGKPPTGQNGTLVVEELGGAVKGRVMTEEIQQQNANPQGSDAVTVNQFVGGAANMIVGEEVLLFAHTNKVNPTLAAQGATNPYTAGSLGITGRMFGRFSILTDPTTSEKHVVRIGGIEDRGIIPSQASVRSFLNAQQKALKEQGSTAPISAAQAKSRLQSGHAAHRHAGLKAAAKAAENEGSSEILDFDKLSEVRARVQSRLKVGVSK